MMLCSLDWNALLVMLCAFWVLSSGSVKRRALVPSKLGQFIKYVVNDMQTSAAGLSQCIIMDILNDVMQFGLECTADKGLHRLGIELAVIQISSCIANSEQRSSQ